MQPRSTASRSVLPILVAVLTAACSAKGAPEDLSDLEELREQSPTQVKVENDNYDDLTIWVFKLSQRHRLGRVDGFSERTFTIPAALIGAGAELNFLANPTGDRTAPVSQRIYVVPGELVELVIPPQSFRGPSRD